MLELHSGIRVSRVLAVSRAAVPLMILLVAACAPVAEADLRPQDGAAADASSGAGASAEGSAKAPSGAPAPIVLKPVRVGTAPPHNYSDEQIKRGELLVSIGSCNDCHTPWTYNEEIGMPVPDMTRMLSGHPEGAPDPFGTLGPGDALLVGPTFTSFTLAFGTTYALNLTPDLQTGSGTWTEQMFLDIFRTGKHLGGNGRSVLPPMPWNWHAKAPDEDLIAIFAYLRSIPPLVNNVQSVKVPEPAIAQITEITEMMVSAGSGQ